MHHQWDRRTGGKYVVGRDCHGIADPQGLVSGRHQDSHGRDLEDEPVGQQDHQDGLLKDKTTYEIMRPESIGLVESKMVMGKLSGRHAFRQRLEELGYKLTDEEINHAFERFKKLADHKKEIYEEDLEVIVSEELAKMADRITLKSFSVKSGTDQVPTATVELEVEGKAISQTGTRDGPVDAVYRTIAAITQTK